jgi:hypothetical protein
MDGVLKARSGSPHRPPQYDVDFISNAIASLARTGKLHPPVLAA